MSATGRIVLAALALLAAPVYAEKSALEEDTEEVLGRIHYGEDGLTYENRSRTFRIVGTLRFQFRASYPFDQPPELAVDFSPDRGWDLDLRRARARVRGYAFAPWLKYMVQYDLRDFFLRDARVYVERVSWLQAIIGLGKVNYNRERVASSAAQEMAERSITNRVFTVDRQIGIELTGLAFPDTPYKAQWTAGVYNGTGRKERNDDDYPMVLARWQWIFVGDAPGIAMGDPEYRANPDGSLALAYVWNRSPYTRFGTAGGGAQLPGFEPGVPGQYTVPQAVLEWAYKHNGISTQGELHWKQVRDGVNDTVTDFVGLYAQAGAMLHTLNAFFPRPLEIAIRFAFVDQQGNGVSATAYEYTLGFNWFFNRHRNKLQANVTYYVGNGDPAGRHDEWQLRLQWDVTF